ncbi:Carboxylesterase [Talaromyces proteolyticus]|uniref:Carboxylic ester hydrolase n=1 Tax=Talaromyces proteolyticus TaxID=1131652 RepID=A0AAD4PYL0_9EURO|nr:Carboxylesterase [Talaromyces proteolyticus]KAH8694181.1 Carboxylesterase [Talaromyces proteolyticus]
MKVPLSLILPAVAAATSSSPSVTIDAGVLQGGRCDGQSAVYYKAIPYAEPPVGALRFEPPTALKQFSGGKLNATTSAPTCLQFSDDFTPKLFTSEDCLYLDVWVPSDATSDSKLPVKVWIYGGSETEGSISDPLYDGCNTADHGAILVSINYRLGPLGFLALNSAGLYGNQGIQDLLLGLQWVQDNIEAFGGDPKKVVLFGQSAGAENAYVIASLPQASSLIKSAVSESGGGRSLVSNASVQSVGASYARALQCDTSDKACLQSKNATELGNAYTSDSFLYEGIGYFGALGVTSPGSHSFYPYVDGNVIPEDPYNSGVNVPTVFGSTSFVRPTNQGKPKDKNEGLVYAVQWALSGNNTASPSAYSDFLRKNFGSAASLVGKYYNLSAFEAAIGNASSSGVLPISNTGLAVLAAMTAIITDSTYRCPAYYGAAQGTRKNIATWTYEFTHNSTCMWLDTIDQKYTAYFGAIHTAEIPFVFGNLDNSYLPNGTCNSTATEYQLSEQIMDLWTAVAENADPSTDAIQWPRFQTAKNLSTPGLIFGESAVSGTVDYTGCDLWDQINASMMSSNATATGTPTPSSPTASSTTVPTSGAAPILPTTGGLLAFSLAVMGLAGLV